MAAQVNTLDQDGPWLEDDKAPHPSSEPRMTGPPRHNISTRRHDTISGHEGLTVSERYGSRRGGGDDWAAESVGRQNCPVNMTKSRLINAVSGLGVIETGLENRTSPSSAPPLSQASGGDGSVSSDNSSAANRTALTGLTPNKPGRCFVRKCEVRRTGRRRDGKRKRAKILLHPMKVDLPAGSMTAIIGPSGSGKSTLMKFLSGSLEQSVVAVGGVNIPKAKSYLGAETNLHSFYTPKTYLRHYDRLTTGLAKGCKSQQEIDGILRSLGLEDRRDVIVGDLFRHGLSHGERRRLDLGLMILGAPDTLFCEEPTQNLDSETALHVMQFLKGYCSQPGRRVIITINKPSSVVWNMIDNVILLAEGRVVYEGPRYDMESFFAFNKFPTPKRFAPVEHYLAVVSSTRTCWGTKTPKEWAATFKTWQEEAEVDAGDMLADDIETCFPTAITTVNISRSAKSKSKFLHRSWIVIELTRRYLLDLFLNPGILWVRFVMYFLLALFIGLLFLGLGDRTSTTSIWSRTSVLFYSLSFFIFMVVAVIPFRCHDKTILKKEIFNGYYHPIAHHVASSFASLFGVLILAFTTTIVMVPMAKFHAPMKFFLDMLLSLNCAEALAQMVTLLVSNYIVGIVALAGLFGFFMLLMGFMLVPSEFPAWLRWAHYVPFHTYAWRSLMYLEFSGPENVFDSSEFPTGMDVLRAYEIDEVNYGNDMTSLFCYAIIIHLVSLTILLVKHKFYTRRMDDWE